MKLDVMLAKNSDSDVLERVSIVKQFVHQFVQNIIEEAIKQSSQTTWLIHCSENCHKLNDSHPRQQKAVLYWTPECNQSEEQPDDSNDCVSLEKDATKCIVSCKSIEINRKSETLRQDVYSLPVDTIHATCSANSDDRSMYHRVLPNCSKCLKPKAIHALNLFKSTHQKTFSDLKLFLLNLYSSSDISVKKIGSEHSAFTTYSRRNNPADETADNSKNPVNHDEPDYENFEKTLRFRKKDENHKLIRIKSEKDTIKPIRKCNRLKRRNFFSLKHSFCSVFKAHKSENRTDCSNGGDYSTNSFKDRSLPPVPNCQSVYADFSHGKKSHRNRSSRFRQESAKENDEDDFPNVDQTDQDDGLGHCIIDNKKMVDFASNIEKVKDVSVLILLD